MSECGIKGCQDVKVWGLLKDGRLYRLSFSTSVLEHINANCGNEYTLQRFRIFKGKRLAPNEVSASGLYGIIDSRRDYTLRISLCRESANIMCDFHWRYLQEVWIEPCK